MGKIIVIASFVKGEILGFRDMGQAAEYLSVSTHQIKKMLNGGIRMESGYIVGTLDLKKSNRGGNRIKK